ncbi:MAG: rane protein, partial [Nocardioides sp.]|nr:rane protein [Nocardioides sp.]
MTTDVLRGARTTWGERNPGGVSGSPGRRLLDVVLHPVVAAFLFAAVLHLLWWWLAANSGGDIAAQDAWAEFARSHPGSAYNLSWYGGMHPVSYSVMSPYVMAAIGVRTTMMIVGTVSAALVALLIVKSRAVVHPLWPSLYGAVALTGNAVSGRVTFGLGLMFGFAAVAAVYYWPRRPLTGGHASRWGQAVVVGTLSMLATAASPVAGLFLGLVAAALWLSRRRPAAYALGVPPVFIVVVSAWLFPFQGRQPMHWDSTILPVVMAVSII